MEQEIINWIYRWFKNNSGFAEGIIININGNRNSTVAAKLCVEAIGADKVFGLIMPNTGANVKNSVNVCKMLHIKYKIIKTTGYLNHFNACDNFCEKAKINALSRIRAMLLYSFGQTMQYRVCGTLSLTERNTGYFTKWGDDAYDFSPISNLTTREITEIGNKLCIPSYFLNDSFIEKRFEEETGLSLGMTDLVISGKAMSKNVSEYLAKEKHKKMLPAEFTKE